jgi:cytidine kinase
MGIVVIGSLALDCVETAHGGIADAPGGSALYFSAAASLFTEVSLVGVVGEDFPVSEIRFLKERGVLSDGLEIIKGGKTFRWSGCYELDMNKRVTTNLELNVFMDFNPVLDERSRKSDYVFLGNIDPELQLRVIEQVQNPRFIGADTIECYITDRRPLLDKVLSKVNMVIFNDEEARMITGEHNIIRAASALRKLGPQYVVVKKGEHGSIMVTDDGLFMVPAYPVDSVIDPTGAGDTFAGGLMGYAAKSGSIDSGTLRKAIVYGGVTASFTVEDFSLNRLRNLTMDEIENRVDNFRKMVTF